MPAAQVTPTIGCTEDRPGPTRTEWHGINVMLSMRGNQFCNISNLTNYLTMGMDLDHVPIVIIWLGL